MALYESAFTLQKQWLDLVLAGKTCYELRTQPCRRLGHDIALLQSGSIVVQGAVRFLVCMRLSGIGTTDFLTKK